MNRPTLESPAEDVMKSGRRGGLSMQGGNRAVQKLLDLKVADEQ